MVKDLTKDSFIELIQDFENSSEWNYKGSKPSLIKFGAEWCAPCRAIEPVLNELSSTFDGKVDIYTVDVDEEYELSVKYGIRSVPALMFVPVGEDPQMITGALPKTKLVELFDEILKVN